MGIDIFPIAKVIADDEVGTGQGGRVPVHVTILVVEEHKAVARVSHQRCLEGVCLDWRKMKDVIHHHITRLSHNSTIVIMLNNCDLS